MKVPKVILTMEWDEEEQIPTKGKGSPVNCPSTVAVSDTSLS